MDIELSVERGKLEIAVITLRGYARTEDVATLKGILDSAEESNVQRIVVNLREVTHLPSMMIGLLVSYASNKNSIEGTKSVALCSIPPSITTVISLLDVGRYFLTFDDLSSALEAFGGGRFETYSRG